MSFKFSDKHIQRRGSLRKLPKNVQKKIQKLTRWKSKRFLFYWHIKIEVGGKEAGRLLSSRLDKSFCLSNHAMAPTKPTQKARGHCHFQCRALFVSFLRAEPVESGSLLLGYFTSPLHSRPVCVFARTLLSAVIKNLTPTKARCFESATEIVALQSLSLFWDSTPRLQGFLLRAELCIPVLRNWVSKCVFLHAENRGIRQNDSSVSRKHAQGVKSWYTCLWYALSMARFFITKL